MSTITVVVVVFERLNFALPLFRLMRATYPWRAKELERIKNKWWSSPMATAAAAAAMVKLYRRERGKIQDVWSLCYLLDGMRRACFHRASVNILSRWQSLPLFRLSHESHWCLKFNQKSIGNKKIHQKCQITGAARAKRGGADKHGDFHFHFHFHFHKKMFKFISLKSQSTHKHKRVIQHDIKSLR
jgi:hypothetical protein